MRVIRTGIIAVGLVAAVGSADAQTPEPGNVAAFRALGQVNTRTGFVNFLDSFSMDHPTDVEVDRSVSPPRLYVADGNNRRLLGWENADAMLQGEGADLVLAQRDLFSSGPPVTPEAIFDDFETSLAVDGDGNVYVGDGNRVVRYDRPFETDVLPDAVYGQADFDANACNRGGSSPSAESLCDVEGLAIDALGNLWIADAGNHRVVRIPEASTGPKPIDLAFGQPDAVSGACNRDQAGPAANTLCDPSDLELDAVGNLFVADRGNDRVLVYESAAGMEGVADIVFGQGSMTSNGCHTGGVSAATLCRPRALALDPAVNLYVADGGSLPGEGRILGWEAPLETDLTADVVLGQRGASDSVACNVGRLSADTTCEPTGLSADGAGNLYAVERGNHRGVRYARPLDNDATAELVVGQFDFIHNGINRVDRQGLDAPAGVAIDRSRNPSAIYVADSRNHRILVWNDAEGYASGALADAVMGQPDFITGICNNGGRSASTFCEPAGLSVDPSGNLLVADRSNHRVLFFSQPLDTDFVADAVFGQPDFASGECNRGGAPGAQTLCSPEAAHRDPQGTTWIADTDNSRVLGFSSDPGDLVADVALGQASFSDAACNRGGSASAGTLCRPAGVASDAGGNLYVGDTDNHRVLVYGPPVTSGPTADAVAGQSDFAGSSCNRGNPGPSNATLCFPTNTRVDGAGNLFVADTGNSRVLEYDSVVTTDTIAERVYGQAGTFDFGICDAATPQGFCSFFFADMDFDRDGTLHVSLDAQNRVVAIPSPLEGLDVGAELRRIDPAPPPDGAVAAGSFALDNVAGFDQTIGCVRIGFSNPGIFARATLVASDGVTEEAVTASPPTASTSFCFEPRLSLPPGETLRFDLSASATTGTTTTARLDGTSGALFLAAAGSPLFLLGWIGSRSTRRALGVLVLLLGVGLVSCGDDRGPGATSSIQVVTGVDVQDLSGMSVPVDGVPREIGLASPN